MTPRVSWLDRTAETVRTLLTDMAADPNGQFEPCVYETARLVALAPSLPHHRQRVAFLLREQRGDGAWGGPAEYDLVTTLSATEALLTERNRADADPAVASAADRGVEALSRRLADLDALPDTVAVEIMVPALLSEVNAHLARLGRPTLPEPPGTRPELLEAIRDALAQGHPVPEKLWHSLELFGPSVRGARSVRPVDDRLVGCSPAATAAWLGDDVLREGSHPGVAYLLSVQHTNGGVPVAAPLMLFERSWVLSTLLDTGVPLTAPRPVLDELVSSLHAAFGDDGAAGGDGLPVDVDDTATGLLALALLGSPRSPDVLRGFDRGDHFFCFPEERTPSTTANAHTVQALGSTLALPASSTVLDDTQRRWCAERLETVVGWLVDQQHPDGSWTDKWHASPYYATVCCAVALARHGGPAAADAVRRAVDWVLATEQDGGRWGTWEPTREETAYAVRLLLRASEVTDERIAPAAERGARTLLRHWTDERPHPPLWHDKDVYTPTRIIRVEMLAALYAAHTDPRTAPLLADATLPVGTGVG
ncbi:prenyltransferase/squalene oxidase repeat-containing protein [Saccharomonospora sp. NB11]|jgi:halimadienyl-diphosphate synthase|uniref:prenyltransferase/squalene oxidase repeat-containing protein n=1 Tax=Saccharomonospora sp. NB11 TaxID=1642298 RepID=UPI0018D01491|nr:prenyltransferase/squalene oxidase repeat-containing protein [Saccharomonospora sp. NB11]